jgi:DNA-directed RNA polymerase II subunit RPB1
LRTLPHFAKDDLGPESRGFVENSYLKGLSPQEFYFHAMGGREGLIDTAVKTADTGYISRRLMKALEDVMVKYDGTVRTSKELLIQFLYGEDGMAGEHFEKISLDLCNMDNKNLEKKCNFIQNIQSTEEYQQKLSTAMRDDRVREIVEDEGIQQQFAEEFAQLGRDRTTLREQIFVHADGDLKDAAPMPVNLPRIITNIKALNQIKPNSVSDIDPRHYFEQMKKL